MKIKLSQLTRMMRAADEITPMLDMPYLVRDMLFYIGERADEQIIVTDVINAFSKRFNALTIRGHLDDMEEKELIKRARPKANTDQRKRIVMLTAKGRGFLKSYEDALAHVA